MWHDSRMTEDNAGPVPGSPDTDHLRAVGRRRQEAEHKLQQFQQQSHEKAAADVESDPARDDRPGGDWTDEGGATPSGAATNTSAEDS